MRRFLIRFLLRLLVVFAVALGGLLLFRSHYRPLLRELAETQIKNATSDLTNDALTELLARDSVAYDRIVYFEKDLNGRITAMKTNILEVNRMKTEILEIINQEILDWDTAKLGIPIGSLIFPELFAGKGFCIPVHVLSIRNSDASFESRFQQAGINQTLQTLKVKFTISLTILTTVGYESVDVDSDVMVAQTVIVGRVPETYVNLGHLTTAEGWDQYGTETADRTADPGT